MKVEQINSFEQTDEDEFTLVALTDIGSCCLTMNTHTAVELHDRLVKEMGEYIADLNTARRAYQRYRNEADEVQWLGESPLDYYRRTGDTGPILDYADALNKAAKENR